MPVSPDSLTLAPETIHLWHGILDRTPAQVASCGALLSPDECARAERLLHPERRKRFIVARALLRQVLACYVHQNPESLRFACNPFGKPSLAPPDVEFNISHAANRLLIAVSLQGVGVDLEQIRELDFLAMAQAALPEGTQAELARATPENVRDLFFRLWTLHEARLKAAGSGFAMQAPEIPAWDLEVGPGFRAAIATAVVQPRLVWREIGVAGTGIAACFT